MSTKNSAKIIKFDDLLYFSRRIPFTKEIIKFFIAF